MRNRGITVIGLIITIMILLILSGFAIAVLMGDNGIISKAQEAKQATEKAEIDEKLKLAQLNTTITNSTGKKVIIDDYLKELENVGLNYTLENEEEYENKYDKVITVNQKYVYGLCKLENGDIIYKEEKNTEGGNKQEENVKGEDEKTSFSQKFEVDMVSSNSITVKVSVITGESIINYYQYSKDDGKTWEPEGGTKQKKYTFEGLTPSTTYYLKMKAVDQDGNENITNVITKTTNTITGLTNANSTISVTPSQYTKGDVTVTIDTSIKEYDLQYKTSLSGDSDETEEFKTIDRGR